MGKDGTQHAFTPNRPDSVQPLDLDEEARAEAVEECESWVAALRLAQHATDREQSCRLLFRYANDFISFLIVVVEPCLRDTG